MHFIQYKKNWNVTMTRNINYRLGLAWVIDNQQ